MLTWGLALPGDRIGRGGTLFIVYSSTLPRCHNSGIQTRVSAPQNTGGLGLRHSLRLTTASLDDPFLESSSGQMGEIIISHPSALNLIPEMGCPG